MESRAAVMSMSPTSSLMAAIAMRQAWVPTPQDWNTDTTCDTCCVRAQSILLHHAYQYNNTLLGFSNASRTVTALKQKIGRGSVSKRKHELFDSEMNGMD